MTVSTAILAITALALLVVNVYQFLVRRSVLRIGEILYIVSRKAREKAAEVRRGQKDIQIIEAHLLDIAVSSRSLLRALGYSEASLGADATASLSLNGKHLDSKSLFRLADNILYTEMEDSSHTDWDEAIDSALNRFLEKVPSFDQEGARRIVTSVARHYTEESSGQLVFSGSGQSRKASRM